MTDVVLQATAKRLQPADAGAPGRDAAIDGWRAIAAICVVLAHAVNYRFGSWSGDVAHAVQRLSAPLAELGVQVFFVISGFIITSLMLRESASTGRVNIAAFYARRTFRIMPPLFAYYLVLLLLEWGGIINLSLPSLLSSATYTCNVGFIDCQWWVAHTWSLAVEEQFYLCWPLVVTALPAAWRSPLLCCIIAVLTLGFIIQPPTFHSNFASFACLACGALVATSQRLRDGVSAYALTLPWLIVGVVITIAPLTPAARPVSIALPLLITYLVFAGQTMGWTNVVLGSAPLRLLGRISYSLYLWQQLFLARPDFYLGAPPSLLFLPVAVLASYWLVEKPFIRAGHRLSGWLKRGRERRHAGRLHSNTAS